MQWLELSIATTSAGIDKTAERLTALGYDSLILDDEADFRSFLENNRQYWDYVDADLEKAMTGMSRIRLYLEDGPDAPARMEDLRRALESLRLEDPSLGSLALSFSAQQDEDWENSYKQYYQPIPVGRHLLVVPKWLSPVLEPGQLPVILDPGLTFGTGAHASTRMCMEALEDCVTPGCSVVDLGCGSGILSIAALRLGAGHVLGVDIDEKAEDVSRENASFNGFGPDRFTAMTGNVLASPASIRARCPDGFDLVLANIVADVIIPLAPLVRSLGKPGGRFICSGILVSRLPEVEAALEAAELPVLSRRRSDDEWCSLTCSI
ncbi:MAG: 50S ribosomal protein L11 methyltransferase [Oscillospiraceae bacterium]|nr:50S ribosomal protein L11 methyltransferase [Oscillospiraceae bacterium]